MSVCVMMPLPNGCWDTLINPLKKIQEVVAMARGRNHSFKFGLCPIWNCHDLSAPAVGTRTQLGSGSEESDCTFD